MNEKRIVYFKVYLFIYLKGTMKDACANRALSFTFPITLLATKGVNWNSLR